MSPQLEHGLPSIGSGASTTRAAVFGQIVYVTPYVRGLPPNGVIARIASARSPFDSCSSQPQAHLNSPGETNSSRHAFDLSTYSRLAIGQLLLRVLLQQAGDKITGRRELTACA